MTKLNLWQNSNYDKTKFYKESQFVTNILVRTTWHLDNRWDILRAAFCNLAMFYLLWAANCEEKTCTTKTQNVTKLKSLNCDKTKNLNVTKLKNSKLWKETKLRT